MLVFVDYEHPSGYGTEIGQQIQAARTWITYRLEDLSGLHCMLVRHDRIGPALLDKIGAKAIFISGNSVDPEDYEPGRLDAAMAAIRSAGLPVFGFCGGFQLTANAFDIPVVRIDVAEEDLSSETLITLDDGRPFEFGYHPVELTAEHPLLDGLGDAPVFRHAHGLHVPAVPAGFDVLARTAITPVQMAVDDERRILGTQFHPEYWTDEHPEGRRLIANFLRWSGVADVDG